MIIRVNDGTDREVVVRRVGELWLAVVDGWIKGVGTTPADAISDLLQILENGDE